MKIIKVKNLSQNKILLSPTNKIFVGQTVTLERYNEGEVARLKSLGVIEVIEDE